jgi:hypothetical protein
MSRKVTRRVIPSNGLALPARRHCAATQDEPEEEGEYMVQGFPGDCWRRLRFVDGHFLSGMTRQQWYRWKPVP